MVLSRRKSWLHQHVALQIQTLKGISKITLRCSSSLISYFSISVSSCFCADKSLSLWVSIFFMRADPDLLDRKLHGTDKLFVEVFFCWLYNREKQPA